MPSLTVLPLHGTYVACGICVTHNGLSLLELLASISMTQHVFCFLLLRCISISRKLLSQAWKLLRRLLLYHLLLLLDVSMDVRLTRPGRSSAAGPPWLIIATGELVARALARGTALSLRFKF